ncbi:hypothetical protein GCM10007423_01550 [Dyadobacter endophyticus]|uniref:Uncharacterized protein n=1 Tax=Dyadobacter endophyticus TaxID=1749036 RepID=A0ABQ1YDV7_9BACT|nr:hypothetical protein GCM10007423_01550 [Dyadobacter endophyticus]
MSDKALPRFFTSDPTRRQGLKVSREKYNVILTLKEAGKIDGGITEYRGSLKIQHGTKKRRFKVHGRYYP